MTRGYSRQPCVWDRFFVQTLGDTQGPAYVWLCLNDKVIIIYNQHDIHIYIIYVLIYIYIHVHYILLYRFIVITMFIQYIITNSVCIYIYAHAYSMCPLMFLDTHGVPATAFSTCDKQGCACKLRPQARQLIERTCFPQKIWLFLYLCAYKYLDVSTTMLYEVNVYLRISKVCVLFCFPKFGSSLFILMWLFCANERYGIFICICCMHVFA